MVKGGVSNSDQSALGLPPVQGMTLESMVKRSPMIGLVEVISGIDGSLKDLSSKNHEGMDPSKDRSSLGKERLSKTMEVDN